MMKLAPEERLIVAADFRPPTEMHWLEPGSSPGETIICQSKRSWVKRRVLELADNLKGTEVYLKVNSALRACGYNLIGEIQSRGLRVFADLKLIDIGETLSIDGALLKETKPELLTTMCVSGITAMKAIKTELPDTEVLGVTVLTSLDAQDCQNLFAASVGQAVSRFASYAGLAELDGIICSADDLLKERDFRALLKTGATINTPGIRPEWAIVPNDDQKRITTPTKAIKAGADRIIVGRPILQAKNPYDAVMRTIEEIDSATS